MNMTEQLSRADSLVEAPLPTLKPLGPMPAQVGDLWYRVEGSHIGDELYEGMELVWTSWRCVKTTAQGAWFNCVEWDYKKPRFALTSSSRAISRTKHEALERLIARKVQHLRMLNVEAVAAQDTLDAARAALASGNDGTETSLAALRAQRRSGQGSVSTH